MEYSLSAIRKGLLYNFLLVLLLPPPLQGEAVVLNEQNPESRNSSTDILIGALFPFHEFSSHDVSTCNGAKRLNPSSFQSAAAMIYAIEMANNQSDSYRLVYEIRDTCRSTIIGQSQTIAFLPFGVRTSGTECVNSAVTASAVIGAASSSVSLQVQGLLRLFSIPQISHISTSDELSDKTLYGYFFRTVPPDRFQSQVMHSLTDLYNWSYVATAHLGNSYGRNGIEGFQELFLGGNSSNCLASEFEIDDDETDVEQYVNFTKRLGEEWRRNTSVLVYFGLADQAEDLIKAINSSNLSGKPLTLIASDGASTNIDGSLHSLVEGMLGIAPVAFPLDERFNTWFREFVARPEYANHSWFKEYKELSNCTDNCNIDFDDYISAFARDAIFAIVDALRQLHKDACSNITGVCNNMTDQQSNLRVDGEKLRDYLRNVTDRQSGDRLFNDDQDRLGNFGVFNLQSKSESLNSYEFKRVGTWNVQTGLSFDESIPIRWNKGNDKVPDSICMTECGIGTSRDVIEEVGKCCWACVPCDDNEIGDGFTCTACKPSERASSDGSQCIPLSRDYLEWSNGWSIALIFISTIGLIATVVSAIIYYANKQRQEIRASNLVMSAVILVGVLLCFILPFFYLGEPFPVTCAFRRAGIGICFSICFGAILVKVSVVFRIVRSVVRGKSIKPPNFIGWKSQLLLVGIIIGGQVILNVGWLVIEKPAVSENLLIAHTSLELRCAADPIIGLAITMSYNALLLVVSVVMSLITGKKAPKEYNETRFLQISTLILGITFISFLPTYFSTAYINGDFVILTQTIVIVLTAYIILFFFIIHKVYTSYFTKEEDTGVTTRDLNTLTTANRNKTTKVATKGAPSSSHSYRTNEGMNADMNDKVRDRDHDHELMPYPSATEPPAIVFQENMDMNGDSDVENGNYNGVIKRTVKKENEQVISTKL